MTEPRSLPLPPRKACKRAGKFGETRELLEERLERARLASRRSTPRARFPQGGCGRLVPTQSNQPSPRAAICRGASPPPLATPPGPHTLEQPVRLPCGTGRNPLSPPSRCSTPAPTEPRDHGCGDDQGCVPPPPSETALHKRDTSKPTETATAAAATPSVPLPCQAPVPGTPAAFSPFGRPPRPAAFARSTALSHPPPTNPPSHPRRARPHSVCQWRL